MSWDENSHKSLWLHPPPLMWGRRHLWLWFRRFWIFWKWISLHCIPFASQWYIPILIKNEEVKYYNLTAQVLAKIIFYIIPSKSGEYSHATGCNPLLIYCLLKDIRVKFPSSLSISWCLRISSFRVGISHMGWWLLISSDTSRLIFLRRLLLLLQLT